MTKARLNGGPPIASPILPAREPTPMRCCQCCPGLECTRNRRQAPFAFSEITKSLVVVVVARAWDEGGGRGRGTCNYNNNEAFGDDKRPSSREERVTVMKTMLLLPPTDVRRQLTRGDGAAWGGGNVTISWGGQRVERAQRTRGMALENGWWRSWWKWGGCDNQPGQMGTRGGGATRGGGPGERKVAKGQEAKVEHTASGAQSAMAPPWFLWRIVGWGWL